MRGGFRRWRIALALVAVSVLFAVGLVEATLRIAGWSFEPYLTQVQFGWPHPKAIREAYTIDDDLFWVTKGYADSFQKARENPPRIVFVGDSCTQIGSYDTQFAELVEAESPGKSVPYLNAGVAGWSSYQGRVQVARDVLPLQPKVVTIYFGWNDHWASFGVEDKDISSVLLPMGLSHLRVVQLMNKLWATNLVKPGVITLGTNRVTEADYRANMEAMVDMCRAAGASPVLLTAPTSHERGKEPEYLKRRWLHDLADLIPTHRRYNAIVREVAQERGAALCDLERIFDALPRKVVRETYFRKDGIHLHPPGDAVIAAALYDTLQRSKLLSAVVAPKDKATSVAATDGGA